jgi:hypothetical protein
MEEDPRIGNAAREVVAEPEASITAPCIPGMVFVRLVVRIQTMYGKDAEYC